MKNTATKYRPKTQNLAVQPLIVDPGTKIIPTSALEGSAVLNLHEKALGQVAHIVIDLHASDVAYIVIARDEVTSGTKQHAVPHAGLMFDAAHKRFILDIDHERLENAPGFAQDQWPIMSDLEWTTQIHDYYGQLDYWLPPNGHRVRSN